jgi:hypothetical protein
MGQSANSPGAESDVTAQKREQSINNVGLTIGAISGDDLQNHQIVSLELIDSVFGIVDALVNTPKSKSQGVEVSLNAAPFRGFTAGVQLLYLDSKITEHTGVNAAGQLANLKGANVPFSPKYQASLTLDCVFPLRSIDGFVGATASCRERSNAIVGFDEPNYQIIGYTLSTFVRASGRATTGGACKYGERTQTTNTIGPMSWRATTRWDATLQSVQRMASRSAPAIDV